MINFFNGLVHRNRGAPAIPNWPYIQGELNTLIKQVIEYYRNASYAVRTDHELVKIIHAIALSTETELYTYHRKVSNASANIAQSLGYTSEVNHGKIFSNVFFGPGSKEVLVSVNTEFDPRLTTEDWQNVRAVRILRHGFDQLDFFPLDGRTPSNKVNVFSVNIPLLAVQYRAFRQAQKEQAEQEGETGRSSVYHFVYSYVLNNMQYDSIPMAIFNRLMKVGAGKPTNASAFRHPFYIPDYGPRVDAALASYVKSIQNTSMDIAAILFNAPMPTWTNGLAFMQLPDVIASRQINWAMYLSRIHILSFLTEIDLDTLLKTNRTELNKVKYMLNVYLKDNSIRSALTPEMFAREKATIEDIVKKL